VRVDILLWWVQAARMAHDVTLQMVRLAGTQAIYASSILDQLVCDAITIAQQISVGATMIETAGAMLVGIEAVGPLAALV